MCVRVCVCVCVCVLTFPEFKVAVKNVCLCVCLSVQQLHLLRACLLCCVYFSQVAVKHIVENIHLTRDDFDIITDRCVCN